MAVCDVAAHGVNLKFGNGFGEGELHSGLSNSEATLGG